jgi:hypothetical protein
MFTRLVAAAAFAGLCLLGLLLGDYVERAFGDIIVNNEKCSFNVNCVSITGQPSGACINQGANEECTFEQSKDNIDYCAYQKDAGCKVIQPYQPQKCSGACKGNPAIGCSVDFNKCKLF